MDINRLKTLAYMEGFVENFIEHTVENPPEGALPETLKELQELLFAWQTVSAGLRDLRKENADLETKIILAKQALE